MQISLARYCIDGGMDYHAAYTLSDYYIQYQKINVAKRMLEHSNYSVATIAEVLAFSSQSHFSNVFFKYTKETPLQYRKLHTGVSFEK